MSRKAKKPKEKSEAVGVTAKAVKSHYWTRDTLYEIVLGPDNSATINAEAYMPAITSSLDEIVRRLSGTDLNASEDDLFNIVDAFFSGSSWDRGMVDLRLQADQLVLGIWYERRMRTADLDNPSAFVHRYESSRRRIENRAAQFNRKLSNENARLATEARTATMRQERVISERIITDCRPGAVIPPDVKVVSHPDAVVIPRDGNEIRWPQLASRGSLIARDIESPYRQLRGIIATQKEFVITAYQCPHCKKSFYVRTDRVSVTFSRLEDYFHPHYDHDADIVFLRHNYISEDLEALVAKIHDNANTLGWFNLEVSRIAEEPVTPVDMRVRYTRPIILTSVPTDASVQLRKVAVHKVTETTKPNVKKPLSHRLIDINDLD